MKKRFTLAATLILSAFASVLALSVIFADAGAYAPPSDTADCYAKEEIDEICKKGYMDCFSNENGELFFVPERTVCRAEFAKILVKYLKIDPDKYSRYDFELADIEDVPPQYLPYVRAICAEGLMGLLSDNGKIYFLPLSSVTREEAGYILGNLIDASVSTFKTSSFSDYSRTNEIYAGGTNVLIAFELMIGYPDGTLRPENDITREELALILYRMLNCGEKLSY